MKDTDLYKEELESLTHKIYTGDLTPLVFEILKTSPDKKALVEYLTHEDIVIEEEIVKAPTSAPTFSDWFGECVQIT